MKKLFLIAFVTSIYFSCASSNKINGTESSLPEPQDNELKTYAIGDTAQGGIVFLVNSDGTHGLACAIEDQFANASYAECSDMMNNPLYHDLDGKKYFDWRLPKVWEAYQMYMNLHLVNIGNFSNSPYWTSQGPSSFDKMSLINFSTGLEFSSLKTDTYRARAVRSF